MIRTIKKYKLEHIFVHHLLSIRVCINKIKEKTKTNKK